MAPIKYWSAEFLEQRMEEHKRWQHDVENALIEEAIDEIQALPARAPRKPGRLFLLLPEPDEKRMGSQVQ